MHFSPVVLPQVDGAICSAGLRDKPSRICRLGVLPNVSAYRKTPSSHILRRPTPYKGYFSGGISTPQKMTVALAIISLCRHAPEPINCPRSSEHTEYEEFRPRNGRQSPLIAYVEEQCSRV